MIENPLLALTAIVLLGVGAQWLAWRFQVPAVLLLLLCGLILGPGLERFDPDAVFGDLLLPFVSLAVGIILFEGGLSLNLRELGKTGPVIRNLVSVGVAVTGGILAVAAKFVLGLDWGTAALLGAILTVTGPTVIGPLLRHVRPAKQVGAVLRWEGILVDPIGAMLAVLVFEVILGGELREAPSVVARVVAETLVVGAAIGLAAAGLIVLLLKRYLIPDFLHSAVSLALVVGAFTAANEYRDEAGLLAVTVMGIALASQRVAPVRHIIEFKENLRVLLLSTLFVVLAARLRRDDLRLLGAETVAFIAIAVFVARPLSVALSTVRSKLTIRERAFLAWMAPRGIVAAAVSSVFALRLAEEGGTRADLLVPVTFAIIIATIALYGGTATRVARLLGVAQPDPQGVLIVGAHTWARKLALALKAEGLAVVVTDTNWANVSAARMEGLTTFYGSVLSDDALNEIDLAGIGRLVALTQNDEVNSLAAQQFVNVFGSREIYQLAPKSGEGRKRHSLAAHLRGRALFSADATFGNIEERFVEGAAVKTTRLSKEFDYEAFKAVNGDAALALFLISEAGGLSVVTTDRKTQPKAGQKVIALIGEPQTGAEPARELGASADSS